MPLDVDPSHDPVEALIAEWHAQRRGRACAPRMPRAERTREHVEADLVAALRGPAPCDACDRRTRCASLRLACSAFAAFVDGRSETRWAQAPRTDASAESFAGIFAGDRRQVDHGGRPKRAA